MLLISHIIIALSSIVFGGYVLLTPSITKLRVSSALIVMTLASGTYLVVSTHSPLLSSCMTGLVYLAVVITGQIAASRKLRRLEVTE